MSIYKPSNPTQQNALPNFSLSYSLPPIFLRKSISIFYAAKHPPPTSKMKKSSVFAASVAAASATAVSVSSTTHISVQDGVAQRSHGGSSSSSSEGSASNEKFAPRFDGLRFIETLITAHR